MEILTPHSTKSLQWIVFCLLVVLHFGLPAIITYDSAHYHTYLEVLNHHKPWSEWDVARGPTFPLMLYGAYRLFGESEYSFLLLSLIGRGMMLSMGYAILTYCITRKQVLLIASVLWSLLILFEPLMVGYFHVVLTEWVAATSGIACLYGAVVLGNSPIFSKRWWMLLVFFVFMTPILYFLKQPFAGLALFPLGISVFLSWLWDDRARRSFGFLLTPLLASLMVLVLALTLWSKFLPDEGAANDYRHSSPAVAAQLFVQGLTYLQPESGVARFNDFPLCDTHFRVVDPSGIEIERVPSFCVDKARPIDAIFFVAHMAWRFPFLTIQGFLHSFLELSSIRPQRFGGDENSAIAMRPFRVLAGESNFFLFPPEWERLVGMYRAHLIPSKLLTDIGLFLFKPSLWCFAFLIYGSSCFALISIFGLRFFKEHNRAVTVTFIIGSLTAFGHLVLHVLLGASIVRFAFPVYPLLWLVAIIGFSALSQWLLSYPRKDLKR